MQQRLSRGKFPTSHLCLEGTFALFCASSKLLARDIALQGVFLSTVRMHLTLAQEAAPQTAQHCPVAVRRNVSQALQCKGKLINWVDLLHMMRNIARGTTDPI